MSDWVNQVFCEDALTGLARIPDGSVDLILTDPPYNLGKDYGNASDQQSVDDYLAWTEQWIDAALPKLKPNGSLYIFLTWRFSPEIFVMLKKRMTMMNEIIWDRRVPSMGGSVRSFTLGARHHRLFRQPQGLLLRPRRRAHPVRRRNQEGAFALDFRRRQVAGSGLQPEGPVERVAPAPRASGARRPPDPEAARNHRAHGQGLVPAGRRGARPVHGQRHHRAGGAALRAQFRRLRTQSRLLRRSSKAAWPRPAPEPTRKAAKRKAARKPRRAAEAPARN